MPSEDSKVMRKSKVEEVEADDEKGIGSLVRDTKKKPSNLSTKSHLNLKKEEVQDDGLESGLINKPGSRAKGSKTKKEEINDDDDDDEDDKPIIKRSSVKIEKVLVKRKLEDGGNVCKSTKTKQEEIREKKAKKVYDMPGQKRDPPEERDPLRIFYETLHKQLPHSEMAQIWMMESGLLSREEAKRVFEKKQQKQKLSSPIKPRSVVTKKEVKSATLKKTIQSSPVSSDKKTKTISKVAVKVTKKRRLGGESSEEDEDYDDSTCRKKKKQRAA